MLENHGGLIRWAFGLRVWEGWHPQPIDEAAFSPLPLTWSSCIAWSMRFGNGCPSRLHPRQVTNLKLSFWLADASLFCGRVRWTTAQVVCFGITYDCSEEAAREEFLEDFGSGSALKMAHLGPMSWYPQTGKNQWNTWWKGLPLPHPLDLSLWPGVCTSWCSFLHRERDGDEKASRWLNSWTNHIKSHQITKYCTAHAGLDLVRSSSQCFQMLLLWIRPPLQLAAGGTTASDSGLLQLADIVLPYFARIFGIFGLRRLRSCNDITKQSWWSRL